MSRAASSRFSLASILSCPGPGVALSAALCLLSSGLIGCGSEPGFESELASDSASEGLRSYEQAAEALAADPRFADLLHMGVLVAQQQLAGHSQMGPEELDAYIHTINGPEFADQVELPEFLDFAGIDPVLVDQQLALTQELATDHGLTELAPDQLADVFQMAAETPEIQAQLTGMIEYELRPLDEPIEPEDGCKDPCIAQFLLSTGVAVKTYVAALAAAAVMGPGALVAVLLAMAAYAYALAEANAAMQHCFAECDGEVPTDEECLRDSDCAAYEYCWTGVLGIGANQCRPEKPEGSTCSRDSQCDSGCCKYHLWSHPFSQVCRPASKC